MNERHHSAISDNTEDQWILFIDIEGFGHFFQADSEILRVRNSLIYGICKIGSICYPESPDRLFAHQIGGDGFIILSEFHEPSLARPIAIATALLKHIAMSGRFAKAYISEGKFADYSGCLDSSIRDEFGYENGRLRIGRGLMTLFPVMGNALINITNVEKEACISGPQIIIKSDLVERIPVEYLRKRSSNKDYVCIDWVHSSSELTTKIIQKSGLNNPDETEIIKLLNDYIHNENLPKKWIDNTIEYLSLNS